MSRIGDIAIGVIIGVGGIIGAALAFDKYGNSGDNNKSRQPSNDRGAGLDDGQELENEAQYS